MTTNSTMIKMKKQVLFTIALFVLLSFANGYSQKISTAELMNWTLLGEGEVGSLGEQVSLQEADISKGIMLVSPKIYGDNVIVKYKVLALTSATVIVTMLSVSDTGASEDLTIPENYDGNIGIWSNEKENYFFAFKNAPHNRTPFVRKNPGSGEELISAAENVMIAGFYYDIEVGREKDKLWLSIDGRKTFEVKDEAPLSGGHIAIRLRGTAGFKAGCLIKEMEILEHVD